MKKLILSIIFCTIVSIVFAQDSIYRKLPDAKTNAPLFLINSKIICGISNLNPDFIATINIYKGDKVPANLKNLSQYGIVDIQTKLPLEIRTKTFQEIEEWLNIKGKVGFAVDGFFVDDETLQIATDGIMEINVVRNPNGNESAIINIWTLEPNKRHVPPVPQNAKPLDPLLGTSPTGVIYIR
jgi:hypothetical protein